jgi:uncharacterized protein YdaU (DUF1376 family)
MRKARPRHEGLKMNTPDTWYKREPQAFLRGAQGMGPELIGAYSVILDILYARGGDMPRDDRHLSGVLGCSIRKARALTDQLIERKKIALVGGKIINERASVEFENRRNQRETTVKYARSNSETALTSNNISHLPLQKRREENNPLTPKGGLRRFVGVSDGVKKYLEMNK